MAVTLQTDDLHKTLFSALEEAKTSIKIVSPFLSEGTIEQLCELLNHRPGISCSLVTRLPFPANTLHLLIDANVALYVEDDLHTKLYIVDNRTAFVGSANFTTRGLAGDGKGNYEMLLCLEDEALLNSLIEYARMWETEGHSVVKHLDAWRLGGKRVEAEVGKITTGENLATKVAHRKRKKQKVHSYIMKDAQDKDAPTVWIKYIGSGKTRREKGNERCDSLIPYVKPLNAHYVFSSISTSGIKKGDIVYIAVLASNAKGLNATYMIARGESAGYDPAQSDWPEIKAQLSINENFGWQKYLKLENIKIFPGNTNQAKDILELWDIEQCKPRRATHSRIKKAASIRFLDDYSEMQFVSLVEK